LDLLREAPIDVSGFTLDEIDQIIITNEAIEQGALEPDDRAVAISRAGDLFELGPHRVVCGDATDPAVLRLLMGGDCAAPRSDPVSLPSRSRRMAYAASGSSRPAMARIPRSSFWAALRAGCRCGLPRGCWPRQATAQRFPLTPAEVGKAPYCEASELENLLMKVRQDTARFCCGV